MISKRKEYVKAIIDELLGDDERISRLSNELFGGIIAIQSVYEAVEVYRVDKEILKKHIDRIFEQSPEKDASSFSSKGKPCPKCKKGMMMDDVCPDELLCHACGYTETLRAKDGVVGDVSKGG